MRAWHTSAIAIVAALGGRAHADCWCNDLDKLQAATWLQYEVSALTDVDDTKAKPEISQLVLAGVRLHGIVGTGSTIAYHVGFDLAAGGTIGGGGFAYDVALFPVGIAARFGQTSLVALGAGIGAIGATGTLDDAFMLPLEATGEFGGGRLRLLARARVAYVAGADGRHDGAPSIPFADELDTMVGVRIGRHYEDYGFPTGDGYFVGVAYRELLGARFVGLTIGYSIDAAMPRHKTGEHFHGGSHHADYDEVDE